jgi:hypothetical protein
MAKAGKWDVICNPELKLRAIFFPGVFAPIFRSGRQISFLVVDKKLKRL